MATNNYADYFEILKALPDLITTASTNERSIFVFMIIVGLALSALVYRMGMKLFGRATGMHRLIVFFGSIFFFMFSMLVSANLFSALVLKPLSQPVLPLSTPTPPPISPSLPPMKNANIYGYVKVIGNKPENDKFLDGVKLEIKGANGSRLQEYSGKEQINGYYNFQGVPISDKQETVLIRPDLNGFALKDDGLQSVEAKINDRTDIFMKQVQ